VKGQSILGSDGFVEKLIGYIKGLEDIKEIPISQRYINRPALKEIFKKEMLLNKKDRNNKIKEAINKYGYSQKEVADHLKLYYTTISRIVNDK
jgi:ribosome-binding protein aMBF1 (putative translation factor)